MALLTSGGSGDLSNILSGATSLMTWSITSMGSIVGFIVDHPVVLLPFLLVIVGFAVGLFMRIWRSVG